MLIRIFWCTKSKNKIMPYLRIFTYSVLNIYSPHRNSKLSKTSLIYHFASFIYQQIQSTLYWLNQELLLYCIAFFFSYFFLLHSLIWLTKFIVQFGTCAMHTLQTYRVYLARKHVQLSLVRRWTRTMPVKNFSFEIHPWFFKNQVLDIRELTSPYRRV